MTEKPEKPTTKRASKRTLQPTTKQVIKQMTKRTAAGFLALLLLMSNSATVQGFASPAGTVSDNNTGQVAQGEVILSGESKQYGEATGENIEIGKVDAELEVLLEAQTQAALPANPVHHCTEENEGSDHTDWSYVYFGSYPQSEVTGSELTAAIDSAVAEGKAMAAIDGAGVDVWINGIKYRRIAMTDTAFSGDTFGDTDRFGDTAYRYFKWERIRWRVLNNSDDGTLFLMADKVLDHKNYNDEIASVTWENCSIRSWLNSGFYQSAFSEEEQAAITPWHVLNEDDCHWEGEKGNDTTDLVYMLSCEEIKNKNYGLCGAHAYPESRRVQTSKYANVRGVWRNGEGEYEGNGYWWLRTAVTFDNNSVHGKAVNVSGDLVNYGYDCRAFVGVVPALHINQSSDLWLVEDDGTSGAGGGIPTGGNPSKPVHHCTKKNDGSDYTDFDYVYFGSYPQSEVRDSATIAAIDSAIGTSGTTADVGVDVWVNGTKYRRIAKTDTNYSGYFDDVENNGYRYFKWERIKWRVLNNNDYGTLFVVADSELDDKEYNDERTDITWENSTIRSWLNGSFYQMAFSSAEKSAIEPWHVVNKDNPAYGTEGGNDTIDHVYLLSIGEVTNEKYGFCSDYSTHSASRGLQTSQYAHARGALGSTWSGYNGNWWLRSPGRNSHSLNAASIDYYGDVNMSGLYTDGYADGVVPALHINLSSDLWSMVDDGSSGGTETGSDVAENTIIYYNNDKGKWEEKTFAYNLDSCLSDSADKYNPELAHMLSALAASAYHKEGAPFTLLPIPADGTFPENPLSITESLRNLGFQAENGDVGEFNYYASASDENYGEDTTAFTLAVKTMSDGTKLVSVVVRGSYGKIDLKKLTSDWKSNVNLGFQPAGLHKGFDSAATEIYEKLKNFESDKSISRSNVKYVITGHSRGAAVANLVAKKLIDDGVPTSKVYDYNFACPDSGRDYPTKWNPNGVYDSLFNINNVRDIVGVIPGGYFNPTLQLIAGNKLLFWGKYGHTYFFAEDWDTAKGTIYSPLEIESQHEIVLYLNYMEKKLQTSSFKSWEQARAALAAHKTAAAMKNYGKIFGIFCPVDIEIMDSDGVKIAEVIHGEAQYYTQTEGEVLIITAGDQSIVYLSGEKDYFIKLTGSDTGEMTYCVSDAILGGEYGKEIVYNSVALTLGKTMVSKIESGSSSDEVTLVLLDEKFSPEKQIKEDGTEQAISDELKKKYADLPISKTDTGTGNDESGTGTGAGDDGSGTGTGTGSGADTAVRVMSLSIKAPSKKLAAGKKVKLSVDVKPSDATNQSVTWEISNKKYASIDQSGKLTLKKAGAGKTVTVRAKAADGSGVKASYKIKIMKHAVKSVKLLAASKTVSAGKSVKIKATVKTTGKNANKVLKWTVSNPKYATVNSKGLVKTKKAGKGKNVTITAKAIDGSNKSAKVKLKIK